MVVNVLRFKIQDYDRWRQVFNEMGSVRAEFGCQGEQVFRSLQDPNEVMVVLHWESADHARNHGQSPELREAMQRAGVMFDTVTTFLAENFS